MTTHIATLFIPGEPMSKSRPRFSTKWGRVTTYTPEATKRAEQGMGAEFIKQVGPGGPLKDERHMFAVHAEFYCATGVRRDVDNMLKLVLDGLNRIAWDDDHQVTIISGRKVFVPSMEDARTVVRIETVGIMPNRKATCQRCGVEFPRPKSQAAKKYCGDDCRRAALRENRKRTCEHCGEKYLTHAASHGQRFCSVACRNERDRVPVTCARCSAEFTKAKSATRSGNAYCSPECKADYWRDQRKSAAKGTCDDCGGSTTKKDYKRCSDCHHAAGGRWADSDAESVKCPACGSFVGVDSCRRCK